MVRRALPMLYNIGKVHLPILTAFGINNPKILSNKTRKEQTLGVAEMKKGKVMAKTAGFASLNMV